MPYPHHLDPASFDEYIGNVRIRWSINAGKRLAAIASVEKVPKGTVKALTEHFIYAVATQLGYSHVLIMGPPHSTTTDNGTGKVTPDPCHITAELRRGLHGSLKVHVYIKGHGRGATAYDHIWASGESVVRRLNGRYVIDDRLSTGEYNFTGALGALASTTPTIPATTVPAAGSANVSWASTIRSAINANQTVTTDKSTCASRTSLVATTSNTPATTSRPSQVSSVAEERRDCLPSAVPYSPKAATRTA
ncbi:hypothetical protein MMC31_008018 [Peltigera leucophlebia]|nr:hypothetical protein [Peltigera leucophlebia]